MRFAAAASRTQVAAPYGAFNLEAMDSHGAVVASARAIAQFAASLPRWTNGAANRSAAPTALLKNATWAQTLQKPGCGACRTGAEWPDAWYGMGWMVRQEGAQHNVWHDGVLEGSNTLVVHSGQAPVEEARQWVVLLNGRTDGAEDAMMWRATDAVAAGAWPLLSTATSTAADREAVAVSVSNDTVHDQVRRASS